ncbi:MAG: hypothetical protein J5I93_27005, partial [Pirellulaceae bacterium]|nr:hypothetical protein [Pirellulaceae bacterium]
AARAAGWCLAVAWLVAGPLAGGPLAAQTLLRWKLAPGQQLSLDFGQQTETSTDVNGLRLTMSLEMRMQVDWQVEQVEQDGTTRLTQTIRQLRLKMQTAGGMPIEYDSRQERQSGEAAQQIAAALAPLLGSPIAVTMSSRGELREVQLTEQAAAAVENLPQSSAFKRQLTREGLRQLLGQAAMVLPAEPVQPGQSWQQARELAEPQTGVKVVSKYNLEGDDPEGGLRITVDTRVELPAAAAALRIREQQQTGSLRFDSQAGRLLSSRVEQKLTTETTYRDRKIVVQASGTLTLTVEPR